MSEGKAGTAVNEVTIADGENNRISDVVVYLNQAHVTRTATTAAAPGLNRFMVEVKPFGLDPDSVQATVFARGETYGVQYKEIPEKEYPQDQARELRSRVKELERREASLQEQRKILEKRGGFFDSLSQFVTVKASRKMQTDFPDAEKLGRMEGFIAEGLESLRLADEKLGHEIQDVGSELKVLRKKLARMRKTGSETSKVIEIVFEAPEEQEVRIEASYVAQNANWKPIYKVDVPADKSGLKLTMFSQITQTTGENWEGVKLAVSSVIPVSGVSLPVPDIWQLQMHRPAPRPMARRRMAMPAAPMERAAAAASEPDGEVMAEMMLADVDTLEDLAEPAPPPPAEMVGAEARELPLSFEYELPQPLDIDSEEGETILPLFTREMEAEFLHYAVPRTSPLTFLACRAKPDKEMLAGKLNVYFDGRFVGSTMLGEKKPGEEFMINLGADRAVIVKRERTDDKVKETFFKKIERGTVVRNLVVRTSIENLGTEPTLLHLLDCVPFSPTDRVEVKNLEIAPEPTERDHLKKQGLMLWALKLEPEKTRVVEVKFTVTYPRDLPPLNL
jgi:uncharacterized protein (TIGR02231 family)